MKTPKMPPIEMYISGNDKKLTIEEAREHIRKLAESRGNTKNKDNKRNDNHEIN